MATIIYKPTLSNKIYIDVSPFKKFSRNNYMCICRCRDHRDMFSTMSEFNLHINHTYHQTWLKLYDTNKKFVSYKKEKDRKNIQTKLRLSTIVEIDDSWCTDIFNL